MGLYLLKRHFDGRIFGGAYFRIGGAYYWRELCVSKWVGINNKNTNVTA